MNIRDKNRPGENATTPQAWQKPAVSVPTSDIVIPVILAGGGGNRLWPLSREAHPKQFLPLLGPRSLLQETLLRYADRRIFEPAIIVGSEATHLTLAEQVQAIGQADVSLILEPVARGTAPAIAVAALLAVERSVNAIILVAPSDHAIGDLPAFHRALQTAMAAARLDQLVTFAVMPQRAETGYGYIRCGAPLGELEDVQRIHTFVEKPDAERAQEMIEQGGYFWNSGMFVIRARVYLEELRRLAPEILTAAQNALAGRQGDQTFLWLDHEAFAVSPNISIDHAVMEHTSRSCAVVLEAGWSDVGTWSELWRMASRDAAGNTTSGDVFLHDSRDCLAIGATGLTALVGVSNLAVINTDDAVLVASLDQVQSVREIAAVLRRRNRSELVRHARQEEIWGSRWLVHAEDNFQICCLTVRPGAELPCPDMGRGGEHSEDDRPDAGRRPAHVSDETPVRGHWLVVSGTARVSCDDEISVLQAQQSISLSPHKRYRLINSGSMPVVVVEVRCDLDGNSEKDSGWHPAMERLAMLRRG
ncbi:MAG TPA: mannose-1-phosphate guanylyltransferase/mannose-6-phosphate isomerase [Dongiaceae bacterium]|nr:mannose-1-phosphate guanylyltransferase/mannose-6-phosphate isomerase [Dongiaceae bacterium]